MNSAIRPSGKPEADGPAGSTGSRGDDDIEADLPVLRSLKEQDKTRNRIVGVVSGLAAWQLTRLVPGSGIVIAVLAVPFLVGAALGRYVLRARPRVRAAVGWFCLIAWFVPITGMLVCGATYVGQDPQHPLTRERVIATLCLLLSIANAVVGVIGKQP